MSKDQILENYLNIAAFGHGAYGITATTRCTSTKTPDLTLEEAALLAALPKAPSSFDPVTEEGRPLALERRNWILGEMRRPGKITAEERDAAQAARDHGHRQPDAERLRLDDGTLGLLLRLLRPVVERAGRLRQGHRRAQRPPARAAT